MLISVHVPKAGGTMIRDLLERHFGPRLLLDYADRPLAPGYAWRMLARRLRGGARLPAAAHECIHGHFLADKYAGLGAAARYVTWLRDPVQRVASHYHYWQRVPDLDNADCRRLLAERLSLEEFAALPRMRDVSARFIARRPLHDFFFIGFVEDMSASLDRFRRLTGIDVEQAAAANCNDEREAAGYELTAATRSRIERLNRRDLALYEAARRLY